MNKTPVYHFIGIGGIGMSALAQVLHGQGCWVRGSELVRSKTLALLEKRGIPVVLGHRAENVDGADLVVRSSAIGVNHAEILAAQDKGIPVVHRAQLLAQWASNFRSIAVAGMHGKTTTTNMIFHMLKAGGMDPTLISGGIDLGVGSNATIGREPIVVLEADESDGSLVFFHPHSAVLTNMEEEHMGFYQNLQQIGDVFSEFASHVRGPGCVAVNADDKNFSALVQKTAAPFVSFGFSGGAQMLAKNVREERGMAGFDVFERGVFLGRIVLRMAGMHNVSNALAAVTIGRHWGLEFDAIRRGLEGFGGTMRRLEWKAQVDGIKIVDDYAHHPTEVLASLKALAEQKEGRLVVVFQPHRYSRVAHLGDDFAKSFDAADEVLLVPVFSAGESDPGGAGSEDLARKIRAHGHPNVSTSPALEQAALELSDGLRPGDTVVGMGAGDIEKFATLMKEALLRARQEVHPC